MAAFSDPGAIIRICVPGQSATWLGVSYLRRRPSGGIYRRGGLKYKHPSHIPRA